MKSLPKLSSRLSCSLCDASNVPVTACETGYVCESCADRTRTGRDNTTRGVKTLQRSLRGQVEKDRAESNGDSVDEYLEYDIASSRLFVDDALEPRSAVMLVDGGEVLPEHDQQFVDTLAVPGTTALDASARRLDLITSMGTDVAAMALDASDTIEASNSLEKMLSHQ